MGANENRRRKKLEAKRSKRKEEKRQVARIESSGIGGKVLAAKNWPVCDSMVTDGIFDGGMGYAAIARKGPHSQVVGIIFLIDMYCLGVKDAIIDVSSAPEWKDHLVRLQGSGQRFQTLSPEAVRKLVEGAAAFAKSFGISACREWPQVQPIFEGIDASQCLTEFKYGKDGKPFFMPGPNDSSSRIHQILSLLNANAGQDNFAFTVPALGDLDSDDDDFDYAAIDSDEEEEIERL